MIDNIPCGYNQITSYYIEVFFNELMSENLDLTNIKKVIICC
jgi:hypothetical protein